MFHVERAAVHSSADEVGIVTFEGDAVHCVPRQNAIVKPWSETLDLRFDLFSQINYGSAGSMAISPGNMLAGRRARRITQRWLRQENKRLRGNAALSGRLRHNQS